MKKTIAAALVICASLTATVNAFADSVLDVREAKLNAFRFDSSYSLKAQDVKEGQLRLDISHKEVTVYLVRQVLCAPGTFCSQRAYPPVVFEARLLGSKIGSCGETIYSAATHQADGSSVNIQVTDHSKDTCMYYVAVPATQVRVMTKSVDTNEVYNHSFDGLELIPDRG